LHFDWGAKLRKLITDYLRNTVKDPTKSIPHPFRALAEEVVRDDEVRDEDDE
jgi:hypothetical protein